MANADATLARKPVRTSSDQARERKKKTKSREQRRGRVGWAFIAPFAVVFVIFLIAPLAYAFYLSLFTKGLATGTAFSGIANYVTAFTDPVFLSGVWFVVHFALVLIPVQMIISLAVALVLDAVVTQFTRFARLMIFLPYAVPAVIGALMWGFLYSPTFGPLQQIFGAGAPFPLSPDNVFYGLLNVVTWQWAGYYMIIIYAALRGIDPTLYEAAKLDGANSWQVAFRIKVPLVASALVLILVFALIGTLQFFTEPQILTLVSNGSITPGFTPNIYAFNQAFQYSNFNYASALSFSLGIVVFIAVYIFLFLTRKRGSFLS
jgi:multiple sugar transport system permease protein